MRINEDLLPDYRTRYYVNSSDNVYTCNYINSLVNTWGTRDLGTDIIADIDNLPRGCSVSISAGSTALNIPPKYNSMGFGGRIYCVAGYADGHHIQLAFHYLSADFFIRYKFYNQAWTAWKVIKTASF